MVNVAERNKVFNLPYQLYALEDNIVGKSIPLSRYLSFLHQNLILFYFIVFQTYEKCQI